MNRMLILCCALFFVGYSHLISQELQGSWMLKAEDGKTHVLSASGDYFSWSVYSTSDGAFGMTKGGTWDLAGKKTKLDYEFHTADTNMVGQSEIYKMKVKGDRFVVKGNGAPKGKWMDLDQGKTTPLTGAWLISGRKRNGEMSSINTNRPRKTMKLLTGTRFQWIAYDVAKKAFYGTGGGTYSAENGVYTENIGFFSRDNSRVGASLQFEFKVENGDWVHSGKSSKGAPLYEVWSTRE